MINKLRLLIREILISEVGTMGVTHPANEETPPQDPENPEGEENGQENNKETPS